jgi:hypothetical protein
MTGVSHLGRARGCLVAHQPVRACCVTESSTGFGSKASWKSLSVIVGNTSTAVQAATGFGSHCKVAVVGGGIATVAIAGGAIAASSRHKTNIARRRTAMAHHPASHRGPRLAVTNPAPTLTRKANLLAKKRRTKMRSKSAMRGLRTR